LCICVAGPSSGEHQRPYRWSESLHVSVLAQLGHVVNTFRISSYRNTAHDVPIYSSYFNANISTDSVLGNPILRNPMENHNISFEVPRIDSR
jgi:hypothetical protein